MNPIHSRRYTRFPFLFGGTFIEGDHTPAAPVRISMKFPFLFGGTFIEGRNETALFGNLRINFPSFSEGLSLRAHRTVRFTR